MKLWYNKRGNININMGFCQQVFPPLASLGAVLIIYIPQLGLRPRSFIYIIRIRKILYIEKVCFFLPIYIRVRGVGKKCYIFFTTLFRWLAAKNVLFFVYFSCNNFLKIATKKEHKPREFNFRSITYYLTERLICDII